MASISKTYQKKSDREHILDAPDTYIGSIEEDGVLGWTFSNKEDEEKMEYKEFNWIPGLYKCFDEGIVNARDHVIRMGEKLKKKEEKIIPVKSINIDIEKDSGKITIMNDGNGIDVVEHPEYKIWIPEMIFGHLRTSTNYNKDEKKIVGGKNGFGFKLVLIYSTWGRIETVDHVRKLKYIQEFKENLSVVCPPKITKYTGKPYTKVSWIPDYKRFGCEGLTDDMYNLLKKRSYDIAAVTDKVVKVKFNEELVNIKSFEQYINMYVGSKTDTKRIYETGNERWEYGVCVSPLDEFTQVSFVNGIYTSKGGKHVDYILNQIIKKLTDYIEKKKKVKVKSSVIKEQLMVFVNCVVENPAFDSQTKDYMNTAVSKFGSSCKVSDKFIEKVAKLGIMEQALSLNEVKQTKEAKKSDGKKTRSVRGIPKLIDANYAGSAKSQECTLILCEGDSAKSGIVSGLSSNDRNIYGVYPLKGKLMNVRDTTAKRISENQEITELKKILGLETNKKYKTLEDIKKHLRYGKVLFMTDQDLDGSHIKGLGINLFDSHWNDLIKIDGFIGFMNTPILKAKKGSKSMSFYNEKEYEDWKKENNDGKGWTIKYYKGLGTSTGKEFKEYFAEKKNVEFEYTDKECSETLDMVFNKTRSNDRKEWLENYDKERSLDTSLERISYKEFVNSELIHFSKYDCERSIPNLVDGLKTSLRKILYSAFKRNLTNEIKVAQFGGYVSEHSGYHHGEASLMKAIVGMAQEYVGSNNINLLMPLGQFGTRLQNGSDSASERYIFTQLNKITKILYPENDLPILNYLDDDGTMVEPEYYIPIIPMILVNGSKGIGTGFSTDIMCYNPTQIINYLKEYIETGSSTQLIEPYYEGFEGKVIKVNENKYLFKGNYEVVKKDVLLITELPIGTATDNYKEFLEKMMDTSVDDKKKKSKKKCYIKDYKDMSTDTKVLIELHFNSNMLEPLLNKEVDENINMLEKEFNLTTTKTNTNMHMFNEKQQLKKYETVYDIVNNYINVRIEGYNERKKNMLKKLKYDVMLLSNRARFIEMQCNDEIDLRRKKKDIVIKMLEDLEFDKLDEDNDYKYLRSMAIDSVIEENITKLRNDCDEKNKEYKLLKKKTIEQMWLEELEILEKEYKKYIEERKARQEGRELEKPKKKLIKKKLIKKYK
jgi:DNA topoisomerase-2